MELEIIIKKKNFPFKTYSGKRKILENKNKENNYKNIFKILEENFGYFENLKLKELYFFLLNLENKDLKEEVFSLLFIDGIDKYYVLDLDKKIKNEIEKYNYFKIIKNNNIILYESGKQKNIKKSIKDFLLISGANILKKGGQFTNCRLNYLIGKELQNKNKIKIKFLKEKEENNKQGLWNKFLEEKKNNTNLKGLKNIELIFKEKIKENVFKYLRRKTNIIEKYPKKIKEEIKNKLKNIDFENIGLFLFNLKKNGNKNYKLFLNNYGDLRYLDFKVKKEDENKKGIYFIFGKNKEKPLYIGRCRDSLKKRFNLGYGKINARCCYKNGHSTNCHINNLITEEKIKGNSIYLYLKEEENNIKIEELEKEYIKKYKPKWNIQLK